MYLLLPFLIPPDPLLNTLQKINLRQILLMLTLKLLLNIPQILQPRLHFTDLLLRLTHMVPHTICLFVTQ